MAKRTDVFLLDDTTGEKIEDGGETVEFGLDGRGYEIDLTDKNAQRLRDALAEFVGAARQVRSGRPVTARSGGRKPSASTGDREFNQAVREWATAEGLKVSERGRIPSEVLERYRNRDAAKPGVVADPFTPQTPQEPQNETKDTTKVADNSDAADSDERVIAWWTGVKKKPAPTRNKVTRPMREAFREEVLNAG